MGKFVKGAVIVAFSVVVSGFLYFQSNQVLAGGAGVMQANQSSAGKTVVAEAQDNGQGQENDQRCENKKHPSGEKPDPNKIDCDCHPKCVDGKRVEDNTNCWKKCKPDKCDCPDPCPKT